MSIAFKLIIPSHEHIKMMCLKEMCATCRFVRRAPLHFIDIQVNANSSLGLLFLVVLYVLNNAVFCQTI